MELEYCTNQELIDELMNRPTFAGIILHSADEQKQSNQVHDRFSLITKTSPKETLLVLEEAVFELKNYVEQN